MRLGSRPCGAVAETEIQRPHTKIARVEPQPVVRSNGLPLDED